jgi:hypothetical protein
MVTLKVYRKNSLRGRKGSKSFQGYFMHVTDEFGLGARLSDSVDLTLYTAKGFRITGVEDDRNSVKAGITHLGGYQ